MTRRRADGCGRRIVWLAALLLQAVAAHAGSASLAYDLPPQWSDQPGQGAHVLKPPGPDGAHVTLMLLPTQTLEPDMAAQFARLRKAAAAALSLADERELAPARQGQDARGIFMIWSGSYQAAAPATGRLWLTVMSRGMGEDFASAVFAADATERVRAWLPASVEVFNSLRSNADAAAAGGRSPPASSTPPAPTAVPTAVPTGIGAASLAALAGTWAGNTTRRVNNVAFGRGALTLRIAPDGRYEYLHEAIDPGCSITRSATGTLSIASGLLVMMPTRDHEHRVRHKPDALCTSGDTDLPLQPRRFKYDVQHVDWRGQASYQLSIWHDTEPSQALMRLVPRPQAAAMPRPAALAEPGAPPAGWMLGAWRAVSLPAPVWQLDARAGLAPYRADLELLDGGRYRLRVHRPDVLDSPLCTKSVDLEEEGDARQTLAAPNLAQARIGSMALVPRQSRLTERVERCGTDTRTSTQELSHAPRYLWFRQLGGRVDLLDVGCNLAHVAGRTDYPIGSYLICPETADILSSGYRRP